MQVENSSHFRNDLTLLNNISSVTTENKRNSAFNRKQM